MAKQNRELAVVAALPDDQIDPHRMYRSFHPKPGKTPCGPGFINPPKKSVTSRLGD